mgnify:CR=1 FL=1
MVAILGYSRQQIFAAVKDMYTAVAIGPGDHFHFPVGRAAARRLGYADARLARLPEALCASFAGVGHPFSADTIRAGDTVLDVGAGAGNDSLIAADLVGPGGRVIALDLTAAMTRKLRDAADRMGADRVDVLQGSAECLPLADECIDVITSNGMLNLVPDKRAAVREMFRVLRPGGRVQIADIVIDRPVSVDCHTDPRLWVECVVGATIDEDFVHLFRDAGFDDVEILRSHDYFAHSPSAQTREIAANFGARSVEASMRRGARVPSRARQWLRRLDPRRLLMRLWRRGFVGALSLGLALLSCYGTFAALAALAMLGAGRTLDHGVWAGTIVVFTLLAAAAIASGVRYHRAPGVIVAALAGAGAVVHAQLVDYSAAVELGGFGLLAIAAWRDIVLRRRHEARVLGLSPSADRSRSEAGA